MPSTTLVASLSTGNDDLLPLDPPPAFPDLLVVELDFLRCRVVVPGSLDEIDTMSLFVWLFLAIVVGSSP